MNTFTIALLIKIINCDEEDILFLDKEFKAFELELKDIDFNNPNFNNIIL